MPAFAALVLNDGQATPVAHTFSQVRLDQVANVAMYADRSTGVAIGYPTAMASITYPKDGGTTSSATRVNTVKLSVQLPVLETLGTADTGLTPPPTVAFFMTAKIEVKIPERASVQNRKDILAYARSLLANGLATSMVVDNEAVW